MPAPKRRPKGKLRRNNRGQFLILSALSIVVIMVTFASLLAYTSVSRMLPARIDFRKVTTEATLNFRRALAASLAEVSKNLDYKASISRYENYTSLDEYPEARLRGYEFMSDWQKTILLSYPGLGLNLSVSQPYFNCEWDSKHSYSLALSNVTLDILAYGFYGWKSKASIELNLTILDLDLNKTDGKTITFYFQLLKENGAPVTDLSKVTTSILFKHTESEEFTLSKSFNLTYLGGGYYLSEFSMYSTTILEGFDEIKNYISQNMTEDDFKPEYKATGKEQLCNMLDQVIGKYNAAQLPEAYANLTEDIRPKLVPGGAGSWIVDNANTTYVLAWIDIVRSQLLPKVRVALQDSRGIVVGAACMLSNIGEDNAGPITRFVDASPNPTMGFSSVTLTAWIDDLTTGLSNIVDAEYFVNEGGKNGNGTPMAPSDGRFDSVSEGVKVVIDVSSWVPGTYAIHVHGKDEAGFWGEFNLITINVTETPIIYILRIEMYLRTEPRPFFKLYRAEAVVTIVDSHGKTVEGARVYGHWSGSVSGKMDGTTDENGMISFLSRQRGGRPTFTFTVDNVVKNGCIYNASLNVETSDTIRV